MEIFGEKSEKISALGVDRTGMKEVVEIGREVETEPGTIKERTRNDAF